MCDRIALIQSGKILSTDTPENITKSYPVQLYDAKADNMYGMLKSLRKWDNTLASYAFGEYAHVSLKTENAYAVNQIAGYLKSEGHTGIQIKPAEATVEDSFIRLLFKSEADGN
jgi:ABC-type multidrug transport system ATPase subunit